MSLNAGVSPQGCRSSSPVCQQAMQVSGGSMVVSVLRFWWVHTGVCSQFLAGPYRFLFSVSGGSIQVSVLSFWWVYTRFCSQFLVGPYRFLFSVSGGSIQVSVLSFWWV